MKVIDLLNKIANKEEVPKKIEVFGYTFLKYEDIDIDYYATADGEDELMEQLNSTNQLNEKVEIIEEPKEIEKLGYFNLCKDNEDGDLELTYTGVADTLDEVYTKINELIDVVNELKKENK